MKRRASALYAVVLLIGPAVASAQKTEIAVETGKVIAQTGAQSVAVESGWKAVLMPGRQPIVTVDDPLVDAVMDLYKWVEAEKQARKELIEAVSVLVIRIDEENRSQIASLSEVPNTKAEAAGAYRVEDVALLGEPKFYDLQGHLLPFDVEQRNLLRADYTLHFPESVQPGARFKYVCVSDLNGIVWHREGPLWILPISTGRTNCLAYERVILPPSAIFVDSSRPALTVDSSEGRVAVTTRRYTGPALDDGVKIAFLWPAKDGKVLADLPARYRGLRDRQEEETVREGRLQTAGILAGESFDDQSSPLTTLLSLYSAVVHEDTSGLLELIVPGPRGIVAGQMDGIMKLASVIKDYQFLGTPEWPEQPSRGYQHPVYLAREGSLICEVTVVMEWQDGKWYLQGLEQGRTRDIDARPAGPETTSGDVRVYQTKADLKEATYEGLPAGTFMRRWLILGPIDIPWHGEGYFPDEEAQKKAFAGDMIGLEQFEPTVNIEGRDYTWAVLESDVGVADLARAFDRWYVAAYLWAQIDMPEQTDAVLGIGSDDGVKVWLNGRLVHENWTMRGAIADDDRVPVTFKKGRNQLVLKIQNAGGAWGFSCRRLAP